MKYTIHAQSAHSKTYIDAISFNSWLSLPEESNKSYTQLNFIKKATPHNLVIDGISTKLNTRLRKVWYSLYKEKREGYRISTNSREELECLLNEVNASGMWQYIDVFLATGQYSPAKCSKGIPVTNDDRLLDTHIVIDIDKDVVVKDIIDKMAQICDQNKKKIPYAIVSTSDLHFHVIIPITSYNRATKIKVGSSDSELTLGEFSKHGYEVCQSALCNYLGGDQKAVYIDQYFRVTGVYRTTKAGVTYRPIIVYDSIQGNRVSIIDLYYGLIKDEHAKERFGELSTTERIHCLQSFLSAVSSGRFAPKYEKYPDKNKLWLSTGTTVAMITKTLGGTKTMFMDAFKSWSNKYKFKISSKVMGRMWEIAWDDAKLLYKTGKRSNKRHIPWANRFIEMAVMAMENGGVLRISSHDLYKKLNMSRAGFSAMLKHYNRKAPQAALKVVKVHEGKRWFNNIIFNVQTSIKRIKMGFKALLPSKAYRYYQFMKKFSCNIRNCQKCHIKENCEKANVWQLKELMKKGYHAPLLSTS